uniref:FTH domain-containing protein n=1 Tax=Panagrellus redivivus TaxID=6233 RepID=A0A7E4ZUB7_PANRE
MAEMPLPDAPANNEDVSPDAPANADANQPFNNHVIVRNLFKVGDGPRDLLALAQINSVTRDEVFHMLRKLQEVRFISIERETEMELQFSHFTATGMGSINANLTLFAKHAINLRSLDFSECLHPVGLTSLQGLKNLTKLTINSIDIPFSYIHDNVATYRRLITNNLTTLKELNNPPYDFLDYVDRSREESYFLDVLEVDISILKPGCHFAINDRYVFEVNQLFTDALKKISAKKLILLGHNRFNMFLDFHTDFIKSAAVRDLVLLTGSHTMLIEDFQYIQKWTERDVTFPNVERLELHFLRPAFVGANSEYEYKNFITQVSTIFPNLQLFELRILNKVPRNCVSIFDSSVRNYWNSNDLFDHHIFVTYPKSEAPSDTTLDMYLGTTILKFKFTVELTYTCI